MSFIGAATDRAWRELADLRRRVRRGGSASIPKQAFGNDRRDTERWTRITADRHERYRELVEPPSEAVAIVCVSNRPERLTDIRDNVLRQVHRPLELVLVLNDSSFDANEIDRAVETLSSAGVQPQILVHPDVSLGTCLNRGVAATSAPFIAKFDDDDRYGAAYLADALRAHAYSGAGVVGKHTHFVVIESSSQLLIRFPAHEFRYTGTLAGGTLVIDRRRTGAIEFPDVSLGEDRGFLRRCHRGGISTFGADRFNYVLYRGSTNTWKTDDNRFLGESVVVGGACEAELAER